MNNNTPNETIDIKPTTKENLALRLLACLSQPDQIEAIHRVTSPLDRDRRDYETFIDGFCLSTTINMINDIHQSGVGDISMIDINTIWDVAQTLSAFVTNYDNRNTESKLTEKS